MNIPWYENPGWLSFILALVIAISTVLWKFRANILSNLKRRYPPGDFNIAIAINPGGKQSGNLLTELKKVLKGQIALHDLSKTIHLHDFGTDLIFKTKKEAEEYRQKYGIDLLIWGETTADGLKKDEKDFTGFTWHFTTAYPGKNPRLGSAIGQEFLEVSSSRKYTEILGNSIDDLIQVGNELFDVASFMLALTLKLFGRLTTSREILEAIIDKNTNRKDQLFIRANQHLKNIYNLLVPTYVLQRNTSLGIQISNKALKYWPDEIDGYANLAVFKLFEGEIDEASSLVDVLLAKFPYNPVTWLDLAFFRIQERRYDAACKQYLKVARVSKRGVSFNPVQVISFLEDEYDKHPDPAYLFGSGIINYYFVDTERAKDLLTTFISDANTSEYDSMTTEAKRLTT